MDMCCLCLTKTGEGTATVASSCCAHEKKQGGHSHRRKFMLCPRNGTRRAQPPPGAHAVPTKWHKEGTATVASSCCAHEMAQGGHSHRRKFMLCPRKETRRAQTPSQAHAVPTKRNKEGTDTVASSCSAHEKKQGGHSRRQELTLCPRENKCLHLDRNMM